MSRFYKQFPLPYLQMGRYKLIPIRNDDMYPIRVWRNEQIDVLRQRKPLTVVEQEQYFASTIKELFIQDYPEQLLFSFTEDDLLIGYGGLVHINWVDKNAEISFLTETQRSINSDQFISDWGIYLELIKKIADTYLNLDFIFTYAFDIRPNLYIVLEQNGFKETERKKSHVKVRDKLTDVVIHKLFLNPLYVQLASKEDVDLYYKWVNDSTVRFFSFQQDEIPYAQHVSWFNSKVNDLCYKFYLFKNKNDDPVGQVRINTTNVETDIGISIDENYRGLGYGTKMLHLSCMDFFKSSTETQIVAYIKTENKASLKIFTQAGFTNSMTTMIQNVKTYKFCIKNERI